MEKNLLTFANSYTISDIINFILLLIAVIGIFLTRKQIMENKKIQKATFFKDLYSTMFSDPEIRNAYYRIEYEDFTYDSSFHASKEEKEFDRLFSFIDLICDLYSQGILSKHEMSFFKYEFKRIYNNHNVKSYLFFLTDFYISNNVGTTPFPKFIAYCKENSF